MTVSLFIRKNIPRSLFLSVVTLASALGIVTGTHELTALQTKRKAVPFTFYGELFQGLNAVLKNEATIGYSTDKDITGPQHGAQFQQAQLGLAPLVLDLNSTSRRYTLFDCLDPKACLEKAKAIGARPLKITKQGIFLTIKE